MKTKHLYPLLIIWTLVGCVDIIESDLGEQKIIIIAPSDSARNDKSSQSFFWEDLREDYEVDIEFYNLQIVQPSFDSANRFVLDTNLTTNTYTYSLEAGEYEWRVRGENANTKTSYTTHKLYVDSLFNLTNASLILTAPGNLEPFPITDLSSGVSVNFEWDKLLGADEYTIDVYYGSINGIPSVKYGSKTTELTYSSIEIKDSIIVNGKYALAGTYEWRVTAKNIKTNSKTSSSRKFTVNIVPK